VLSLCPETGASKERVARSMLFSLTGLRRYFRGLEKALVYATSYANFSKSLTLYISTCFLHLMMLYSQNIYYVLASLPALSPDLSNNLLPFSKLASHLFMLLGKRHDSDCDMSCPPRFSNYKNETCTRLTHVPSGSFPLPLSPQN
jgi:hypothetical protein